ncbi:glycosyltransferase, partial [candidate division KSB1 bacterium]|nr:glycosyltransferase [candidate division KSB1 bacterium]
MQIGGAEQVICNLIEKTDSAKYDSSILCIDQPIGPFGTQLNRKGFQVFALRRKPGFDSSLIRQIRHFIVSHDIDILHCHQYSPYVYGVLGAAFTRAKVIFTEHGRFYPDQRKLLRVLLNPFLALFTDYITAISSATKEALIDFENFSRAKIKVIYNGIDDS